MGYHFNTSPSTCTTTTYVDDLIIITDNIQHIQPQINKLHKFTKWSYVDLNLSKYAIMDHPNKSKFKLNTFKPFIQSQNITYKSKSFPILTQNESYMYLGNHLMPLLKWNLQKEITLQKTKQQSKLLTLFPGSLKQKIKNLKHSH